MKKLNQPVLFILMLIVVLLAGCGAAAVETPDNESAPAGGTDVYVDEIMISIMESFPVQVSATVRGNLADGCVTLNGMEALPDGDNSWVIEIDSSRDPDMACTEALVPFEEALSLDVYGLPAGTYTVTAGDETASFTLDMDNAPQEAAAPEPVITLERTACFGYCPVYVLTLYSDGRAIFEGQGPDEPMAEQIEPIGVEGVNALVERFVAAGYMEWEDAYTNREMTDMPSAITSLTVDGRTKRIDHYQGDSSAPEALSELEDLVDAAVNTGQWLLPPPSQLANPATTHCIEQGGRSEIRADGQGNQYGVCIFEDGSECEEWAYFREECEPSTDISWETAEDLIRGGFVEMAFQLHDLTVGLELKDGRTLDTVEPRIDALFAVVDECGEVCGDIVLATE